MARAASSSSPSVRIVDPGHPVKVESIRPHASVAAGVSVFTWYDPLRGPGSAWDPFAQSGSSPPKPPRSRERPRGQRVRLIRFDIDRTVWNGSATDLVTGACTTMERLRTLTHQSMRTFVTADAASILARREHSEVELVRKLRRKGYDKEACRYALDALHARGYQDDRRFAAMWVRSAMRGSGKSRRALLAGLAERGVPRDIAEETVAAYESDHPDCFDIALNHALSRIPAGVTADRERVMRRLVRAGFPLAHIKKHFT